MPSTEDQSLKARRPGSMSAKKSSSSGWQVRRSLPTPFFRVPRKPRTALARRPWRRLPPGSPFRSQAPPPEETMDEHDVAEALFSLSNMGAKVCAKAEKPKESIRTAKPDVATALEKKKRLRVKPDSDSSHAGAKHFRQDGKQVVGDPAGASLGRPNRSGSEDGSVSETDNSLDAHGEIAKSLPRSNSAADAVVGLSPLRPGAKSASKGKAVVKASPKASKGDVPGRPFVNPASSEEDKGSTKRPALSNQPPQGRDGVVASDNNPRLAGPTGGNPRNFPDHAATAEEKTPAEVVALAAMPPQLRRPWKRCAAHVYIAHLIEWQQGLQAGYSSANGEPHTALMQAGLAASLNPSGPPQSIADVQKSSGGTNRSSAAAAHQPPASSRSGSAHPPPTSVPMGHQLAPQQYAQQLSMAQQLAVAQQLQGGFPFLPAGLPFPGGSYPVGGAPRAGLPQGSATQFYPPPLGLGLPHLPPGMAPGGVSRVGEPGLQQDAKREEAASAAEFSRRAASQFAQMPSQEMLSKQLLERSGMPPSSHFGLPSEMHLTPEHAKLLYGMALNMGGGAPQGTGSAEARLRTPYTHGDSMAQAQSFRAKS